MIQITGLTKVFHRGDPPALLDLTFDARPGEVTAVVGPEGAGKTTALRLMLELERGQGLALFDGRTYRKLRRPEREVGVLLSEPDPDRSNAGPNPSPHPNPNPNPNAPGPGPDAGSRAAANEAVVGHPGRRARGHLRMLAAAVGVPARRADELLEQVRLATVAEQRLRTFSPGMHRRLALATALLGDPGTLLLDAPTEGLSPRNIEWFHAFLRSFAVAGGTVLVTTRAPKEAAQLGDRVVTLDQGRMLADQPVAEFRRTRLSPEVAVRGPQMARLADLLIGQGAEVRRDGGAGLAVAGIGRTEIGELAYRHGILLHELADREVEQPAPKVVFPAASGRSGHIRVQPSPALPEPAEASTAEASTAEAGAVEAAASGPTVRTRSVPAPTPVPGALPALSAAVVTTPAAPLGPADPMGPSPTVSVDRLFRDDPTARNIPTTQTVPTPERMRSSAEQSNPDTVRLGRIERPAPTPTAPTPAAAAPTPDHRSE